MAITENVTIFIESLSILWQRILEILSSPFNFKEMLFILIPLLVVLLVIELYFGKYRYEKLGWNTAVGNSLVLFFVGMNLLNFLYTNDLLFQAHSRTALAFVVVIESIFLMLINFFHIFPKEASFNISSALVINYIGAASIIMVYAAIPFDYFTFAAFIVIFSIMFLLLKFLQSFETPVVPKMSVGEESIPVPEEKGISEDS